MNHYKYTEHAKYCNSHPDNENKFKGDESWYCFRNFCKLNPKHFLFFFNNDFHMLTYHQCLEFGNHLDWKEDLLNNFAAKFYKKEKWQIERSHVYDGKKQDKLLKNIHLNLQIEIVNYMYSDMTGKRYCFVSKKAFNKQYFNLELMKKNYKKAKKYLKNNGFDYKVNELKELYRINYIYVKPVKEIKSIDLLIKNINKNGNTRQSKQ